MERLKEYRSKAVVSNILEEVVVPGVLVRVEANTRTAT